jgi:hypothetical protein
VRSVTYINEARLHIAADVLNKKHQWLILRVSEVDSIFTTQLRHESEETLIKTGIKPISSNHQLTSSSDRQGTINGAEFLVGDE